MFTEKETARAGEQRAAAKNNWQKQPYQKRSYPQGKFNRSALPSPTVALKKLGIAPPGRANYAGYWSLRCPLHKDGQEKNASLSMHSVDGHFRCFTCGAHGGDILAFFMAVTGKGFRDAAVALGAWGAGA